MSPQERLEREYNLDLVTTAPTVVYKCVTTDGEELTVNSPGDLPEVFGLGYKLKRSCRMCMGKDCHVQQMSASCAACVRVVQASKRENISEPYVRLEMVTPTEYVGNLMELATNRRGEEVVHTRMQKLGVNLDRRGGATCTRDR